MKWCVLAGLSQQISGYVEELEEFWGMKRITIAGLSHPQVVIFRGFEGF